MSQGQGLALNNVYWDQISLTRGGTASQPGGTPGSTVVPTPPAEVPFVVPQGVRPDGSIIHIVQEGDTLSSIAFAYYEDYGTTVALIAEFNEGIQPNTRFLTIGQEIIILPPGSVDPATGQLLPEDERGTPRAASTAEATEESDASGTAEATEEATAAASITPVATATPRSVAQQTTVPLPPLPGQPTQAGAIGAQAASTAEAEPEPTEEATEAAAEEPVETTPEPTAVALAEVPPAGDAASGLIAADGTLCVSVYQDVNQNQVRDEGEASVPGGEIVLQPPDAAATNYPYTEGDDPLCLDLLPGRYEVQAALPEGYGMTTAETALVTLVRGREVRVAFGGAEGYTPPAVPEAPAEDDAPEAESLETGAVAPMVEVSADGDDEDQSALDRIYDNSGLFVLGFAGVVLVSGAALILALRRFGR
jgi:LysM repeat protein